MPFDKDEILAKQATLRACADYLKSEFIGIDYVIDQIIDYISIWYLMPELLTRPIIINLWGMTGVGKTDLVRKMVKFLHYQDRFTEIELSNQEHGNFSGTVSQILQSHGLNDEKPAIVLFDEIQRFSTINPDGSAIPQSNYVDFWELLSDGRLSRKTKTDLDHFMYSFLNNKRNRERARSKGEEVQEPQNLEHWEAMTLQSALNLDMNIMQLTEMKETEMLDILIEAKNKKKIYEPVDHSKTLVIISGNLDEAFRMARQTSEADVDADIFHAFTKKVTMVDIKDALSGKFRPEQVARFGNIHIIYRALRKQDFQELIRRDIRRKTARIRSAYGITISITPAVERLVYRNGVFPVQGVRPVFSSIVDILEANWNKVLFEALMQGIDRVAFDYDVAAQEIVATYGQRERRIPYVGRIDRIRQAGEEDAVANISVHESGHAVAYLVLTGMVPLQLKSKIASSRAGGFTFPHQLYHTRHSMLDKIRVFLAGGLAEELVFGADHASTGRISDREEATTLAIEYVRRYGFVEEFQSVYNLDADYLRMDNRVTDPRIEQLMQRLVKETRQLLEDHRPLLLHLSRALQRAGTLKAEAIVEIANGYGIASTIRPEGHLHITGYDGLLNPEGD